MENLCIKPTRNTPLLDFNISGKLLMSGSAYAENADDFFKPAIDWVKNLQSEEVDFKINLDYMNTSSSKKILFLLQTLESNSHLKIIQVNWHYENDDDDTLETVQIIEESLKRTKFTFISFEKKRKPRPLR